MVLVLLAATDLCTSITWSSRARYSMMVLYSLMASLSRSLVACKPWGRVKTHVTCHHNYHHYSVIVNLHEDKGPSNFSTHLLVF